INAQLATLACRWLSRDSPAGRWREEDVGPDHSRFHGSRPTSPPPITRSSAVVSSGPDLYDPATLGAYDDAAEQPPKDACGVFGVWAPGEDVAKLTYFGLYALQHRGQEAA